MLSFLPWCCVLAWPERRRGNLLICRHFQIKQSKVPLLSGWPGLASGSKVRKHSKYRQDDSHIGLARTTYGVGLSLTMASQHTVKNVACGRCCPILCTPMHVGTHQVFEQPADEHVPDSEDSDVVYSRSFSKIIVQRRA